MAVKKITSFPKGEVVIPPSKSVSHRAILCAALATGVSKIKNIDLSKDIEATLNCVKELGAEFSYNPPTDQSPGEIIIEGVGGKALSKEEVIFKCGESGSTLRFIIPIALALSDNENSSYTFLGEGRLLERPLDQFATAFEDKGIMFKQTSAEARARGKLSGGVYSLAGDVSSQFITGLLFALPLASQQSEIVLTTPLQSKGYVDLTLSALKDFGINIINEDYNRFIIPGGQSYSPREYYVEGDFSQAAFFLVSGALGREVCCKGLNLDSLQGDKEILNVLKKSGVEIHTLENGGLVARCEKILPQEVDASQIPDLVPPIAALLCFGQGESRIYNAGRLRIKESDRLSALRQEFNKMGASFTEGEDFLIIKGVDSLEGGQVTSHNDHRIVMASAVASIKANSAVEIEGYESVKKSYPRFFEDFCRSEV